MTDAELFDHLPSRRKKLLASAIGSVLIDIERLFSLDLPAFVEDGRFPEESFFSHNCGPTQFRFESVVHTFAVWGEQLSLVMLDEPLSGGDLADLYRLSSTGAAEASIRDCLGRQCEDVRIWTLKEDFETEEAREVAVSYVFSGGQELFYCIYLHGDLDADYLVTRDQLQLDRVAKCLSLARQPPSDDRAGP